MIVFVYTLCYRLNNETGVLRGMAEILPLGPPDYVNYVRYMNHESSLTCFHTSHTFTSAYLAPQRFIQLGHITSCLDANIRS